MDYPKIKIKRDCLLQVVMFTNKNEGILVDNINGNIKGFKSKEWNEDEFIEIEKILNNFDVRTAIIENGL